MTCRMHKAVVVRAIVNATPHNQLDHPEPPPTGIRTAIWIALIVGILFYSGLYALTGAL